MTVTPHDWPKWIPPYSVATYTLKISATEGYPTFEATLVVDVGTCYTEIPITGARDVECPECPPAGPTRCEDTWDSLDVARSWLPAETTVVTTQDSCADAWEPEVDKPWAPASVTVETSQPDCVDGWEPDDGE